MMSGTFWNVCLKKKTTKSQIPYVQWGRGGGVDLFPTFVPEFENDKSASVPLYQRSNIESKLPSKWKKWFVVLSGRLMILGGAGFAPTPGSGGMGIPSGLPIVPSMGIAPPGGSPSEARQIGHDVSCSSHDLRHALQRLHGVHPTSSWAFTI